MNANSSPSTDDVRFMRAALEQACAGAARGEVPVGAVLVLDGAIVAAAGNSPIGSNDPTAHAEMLVLRAAAATQANYRLAEASLYVTLEPCIMCAGALVHARVKRLIFGARDLRFGGVRSKFRLADSELLNHRVEITEGVLGGESLELLKRFFEEKRK